MERFKTLKTNLENSLFYKRLRIITSQFKALTSLNVPTLSFCFAEFLLLHAGSWHTKWLHSGCRFKSKKITDFSFFFVSINKSRLWSKINYYGDLCWLQMPLLRQVSLDLCDASQGYFDVPSVSCKSLSFSEIMS